MNKREEVSVVFQGTKAGGMVRASSASTASTTPPSTPANSTPTKTAAREPQHRGFRPTRRWAASAPPPTSCAWSRAPRSPLNTPDQALALMKIIDGAYKSAATGLRLTKK
jgi:hypothetical protein